MSRGVTLAAGHAKYLSLLAAATLLASLFTIAGSAVRPATVLAGGECQSSVDHGNGTLNVSISPATIFVEGGVFYAQAVDGSPVTSATFTVSRPRASAEDPTTNGVWCVSQNGNDSGQKGSWTGLPYTWHFDLVGFNVGDEICLRARLPQASGNPKGMYCTTIGAHTTTANPTPTPTPTPTPSGSVVPTITPTDSPSGGVLAVVTAKPATAPPTDSVDAANASSSAPALGLLVLFLVLLMAGIGVLSPKRIRR